MLIGAVTNIALSLLFGLVIFKSSPAFGVALATSLTDAIVLIVLFALTYKDSKKILFNFNNLKIILIGIVLGVFSYFGGKAIFKLTINLTYELSLIIEIAAVFLIGVIIYFTLLILTREKLTRSVLKKR